MEKRVECERCGLEVADRLMYRHRARCDKVPLGEELAKQLDRDPTLSARRLGKLYGVSPHWIRQRLHGTQWSKRRLAKRGAQASAALCSAKYVAPAGPTCERCGLVLEECDPAPLCGYCEHELAGIARRLVRWAWMLAHERNRIGWHYALNHEDRERFRCLTVAGV